jgi:hypothetical protein
MHNIFVYQHFVIGQLTLYVTLIGSSSIGIITTGPKIKPLSLQMDLRCTTHRNSFAIAIGHIQCLIGLYYRFYQFDGSIKIRISGDANHATISQCSYHAEITICATM